MRSKIVAGNWKMNTDLSSGLALAEEIEAGLSEISLDDTKIIIAPPYTHLSSFSKLNTIQMAAQNCHSEISGAYTGEISIEMLKSVNVKYVIVGHSERRLYNKETDEQIAKKVKLLLAEKVTPIFCCGESLEERQANKHFEIIEKQVSKGLFQNDATSSKEIIIAYEPVWAIGTGETASPEQAQEVHGFIRNLLAKKYNQAMASSVSIIYGGSCKPNNAKAIFEQEDIDGGLIGGASLIAKDFLDIIRAI